MPAFSASSSSLDFVFGLTKISFSCLCGRGRVFDVASSVQRKVAVRKKKALRLLFDYRISLSHHLPYT
jgi:hypothetical protein